MGHEHHNHNHTAAISSLNKAFIIGIAINALYVIIESIAGFAYGSMGLLSDAGHNLGDIASLILALIAFKLAKVHANNTYTYGYKKSTILVSLANAVILLVAVGIIIAESIEKIFHPQAIEGNVIAWVAGAGVLINAFTALLFMKDKEKDLNIKGAYLHMAMDALVSVGVVVSGIIIHYTSWYIIDPIIGLVVASVIVVSTWNLLHDSLRLSLDGVPAGINLKQIENIICSDKDVKNCHHLHIWAISTTENALTVHVIPNSMDNMESIKERLKHHLAEAGINHTTLEFEPAESSCNKHCD
ncbi:MAG: cation transporter [Bacteroidia bacterium]|nr:cation transporter [Bacteroidia bacterium]